MEVDHTRGLGVGDAGSITLERSRDREAALLGLDVSADQGRIDWRAVARAGHRFAYARATMGIDRTDPSFARNSRDALDAGLWLGAYHFFQPDEDAADQAHQFISVAQVYTDPEPHWGRPGCLPPALAVEAFPTRPGVLANKVQIWLDIVEKATGQRPLIYSAAGFWKIYLAKAFQGQYSLWLAEYAEGAAPPSGIKGWTFWQHGQVHDVPGVDGPVDLNRLAPGLELETFAWD